MQINGVEIDDTFCEAFGNYFTRVIVTAEDKKWLDICVQEATGYGTSTIHCDSEAARDVYISPDQTPDGRVGAALMFFVGDKKKMDNVLLGRIGQCILTCPTTACFDGMESSVDPKKEFEVKSGYKLKFFGDKFEEKIDDPVDGWKIPVMDGEFIIESKFKVGKGIAGGNFLIMGENQNSTLKAASKAVEAIKDVPNVIAPFPGGVARSGSKVGSKYDFLNASTNDPFCPTLKDKIDNSQLKEGENCVYEVILDGATEQAIKSAIKQGINAAVEIPGVKRISAGNYGGELGKFQYNLHELL
jgi:formylmethanofuran--tetrahydromethanopterin N-formyltransferase